MTYKLQLIVSGPALPTTGDPGTHLSVNTCFRHHSHHFTCQVTSPGVFSRPH